MSGKPERPGSSWRYVACREVDADGVTEFWTIRELYSWPDDTYSWTEDSISPMGWTWMELMDELSRMGAAVASSQYLDMTVDPPQLASRPRRKGSR